MSVKDSIPKQDLTRKIMIGLHFFLGGGSENFTRLCPSLDSDNDDDDDNHLDNNSDYNNNKEDYKKCILPHTNNFFFFLFFYSFKNFSSALSNLVSRVK